MNKEAEVQEEAVDIPVTDGSEEEAADTAQAAEEEKKQEEEAELAISQEDLINAITEMAQIISDLQEQVNKLSGVEE